MAHYRNHAGELVSVTQLAQHTVVEPPHEVSVLCSCPDASECRMERYIADVRTLEAELRHLRGEAD